MRLSIIGPTRDTVPALFALDLARLYAFTREHGPWPTVALRFVSATYVHVGREAVLEAAVEQDHATHVLWLDTDMTLPADAAIQLWRRQRPIVACNCVMRDPRAQFTATREGRRVESGQKARGLEVVDAVGLAVFLMRTDILADVPRPWFRHGWNDVTRGDIGEDIMFCRALREAGHEIHIDHDLSKEIGHIGQYTFRPAPAADRASLAV